MSIPFTTTTVSIARPGALTDPMEAATRTDVLAALPAHISYPSGSERRGTGSKRDFEATLFVNAGTDVRPQDQVTDEQTGVVWQVSWARSRYGAGLDYCSAGLVRAEGATS